MPSIRVTAATRARIEAVLRRGESLTQFIENAVCREAEFRAKQNAAVARAKKALLSADKGVSLQLVEELLEVVAFERQGEVGRVENLLHARRRVFRGHELTLDWRKRRRPGGRPV